jgi:hypothetical protein
MEPTCPHCGKSIMLIKSKDLTATKTVSAEGKDLSQGIVKATTDAVTEKVLKTVDEKMNALGFLEKLNKVASGDLSSGGDTSLSSGWGGAMVQSLKKREELVQTGYDPKEFVKGDPEKMDKAKAASMLQKLIHGSLSKGGLK